MLCVSFLRLSSFFFTCFKDVPNYVLKHFVMAAGKHLSGNFNLSASYWSSFHPVWNLSGSWYHNLKKKKKGHSGYYVIKLWVLFQPDILANFLWNCFFRGRVSSYCQKWVEIQISFLASTDTLGGCCLLLFNVGRNSGFLEGSHNTCMAGRDTSAWRLLSTGFPVTQWGRGIYCTADWWLLLFIKSFIYQYGHMDV